VGVPVARPDVIETTALGAAALAGLAAGVWRAPEDFLQGRTFKRFLPGDQAATVRVGEVQWRRAVAAALHWAGAGEGEGEGGGHE